MRHLHEFCAIGRIRFSPSTFVGECPMVGTTVPSFLTAMSKEEVFAEATSVYDNYVEALETGTFEVQAYARNLSERIIPRGVQTDEVVGIVLLLRDVLARSLFARYRADFEKLDRILDAYEPAANRIAITVAVGFVQERERTIREQEEAIRELSTPVLQVRERLFILPIIGVIDPQRARQLTEQLLRGIRTNRTRRRDRHHRRRSNGFERGESLGAHCRGFTTARGHCDRHRSFPRKRPTTTTRVA